MKFAAAFACLAVASAQYVPPAPAPAPYAPAPAPAAYAPAPAPAAYGPPPAPIEPAVPLALCAKVAIAPKPGSPLDQAVSSCVAFQKRFVGCAGIVGGNNATFTDFLVCMQAESCFLPKYPCSRFGVGTTCQTFDGSEFGPGVCLPLVPAPQP